MPRNTKSPRQFLLFGKKGANHESALRLLLVVAGDIETNPGPGQHQPTPLAEDKGNIVSGPNLIDCKSAFQAHGCKVHSIDEIDHRLSTLKNNHKIASATHNVFNYVITEGNTTFSDYADDGEHGAGAT